MSGETGAKTEEDGERKDVGDWTNEASITRKDGWHDIRAGAEMFGREYFC